MKSNINKNYNILSAKRAITYHLPFAITVLLLIFNSTLIIHNSYSQWIEQFDAQEVLNDIEFINLNTGWVSGRNGLIFKTTNQGKTWFEQLNPVTGTGKNLSSIHPVDSNIVYCVGFFETILKTTNGGTNWVAIRNGPWGQGDSYEATFFIDSNTGWVAGTGYKIMKTTNGGSTFDSVFFSASYIKDFYFKNAMEGILCGDGGIVKKTSNGGLNWYGVNIPLNGNLYDFKNISFVDDKYGWVIGNAKPVFFSTDFGSNWDSIGLVNEADLIYCQRFTSKLIGYCGGSYARMFKTTDGGYNWIQQADGIENGFFSTFWFYNDSIGWTSGAGKILHTTTGGQSVVKISNNNREIPKMFYLYQNYPNPFNASTVIKFDINKSSYVKLIVYNIIGKVVRILVNEKLSAGSYESIWDSSKYSSGVYLYKLEVGNYTHTLKMILVK